MPTIALLLRESANRVYAGATVDLTVAELAALAPTMERVPTAAVVAPMGNVDYLMFQIDEVGAADRTTLSNLSATRALFELTNPTQPLLSPIDITPTALFTEDLITIQRYPGKTNEQFTHLLVNVTRAASVAADHRRRAGANVRLLDPVAGRGTTLNRAIMYGFDATGIEIAAADFDQYKTFLTTFLKDHRIKHRATTEPVKRGPLAGTSRVIVDITPPGTARPPHLADAADGDRASDPARNGAINTVTVEMVRGDALQAAELLPKRKFELIVADLPYGVQHRAASTKQTRRSPTDFLADALPVWFELLAVGGAIGLSWNTKTVPRGAVNSMLQTNGFAVVEAIDGFEHTVDRSINRDLIVATR